MNTFLNYSCVGFLTFILASCGKRQIEAKSVDYTNAHQLKAGYSGYPDTYRRRIEAGEWKTLKVTIDKEWTEVKSDKGSVFIPTKDILSIYTY